MISSARECHAGLLAILALVATSAEVRADFIYSDFSNVSGLRLNGNAVQAGGALRLTAASPFQSGSTFTTTATPLGNLSSFSTYFQFRITASGGLGDGDGLGADGLVFVVQTVSNNVGGAGGFLGYSGISPSLGIEFDTFNNGPSFGDPNGNHVGIDLNGNIASIVTAVEPSRFNNGQVWNVWIDYNGTTNALEVRWSLSSARPALAQLASTVNLQSVLGQDTAFLGFTAGTGSGWGNQEILRWEYRDRFNPIGTGPVIPEPTSVALLAAGLLLLGFARPRPGSNVKPDR